MPYKDPQKAKEVLLRLHHRKRVLMLSEKASKRCRDCGYGNPLALDFHHIEPSLKHPLLKARKRTFAHLSLDDIAAEMEKCIVLCANCHRLEEARVDGHNVDDWRSNFRCP